MAVAPVIPMLAPMVHDKTVTWDTGSAPIRTTFYGIQKLDEM
jgi:hypothetical protein